VEARRSAMRKKKRNVKQHFAGGKKVSGEEEFTVN